MVDIVGYFPATLAIDSATGARLRNAEAQVYAITDTAFATPLAITDMADVPFTGNTLTSNSDGIYPEFKPPAGVMQVIVKSGTALTPMTSIYVAAETAATAAVAAAAAAAAASSYAGSASSASQTAAQSAASAAAVGATVDAQTAAVLAQESASRGVVLTIVDDKLDGFVPGTPLATVDFGTNASTPRPDAVLVIWRGDPTEQVTPIYVEDGDIVLYPTATGVVPAWQLADVPGVAFDFDAASLTIADGAAVAGQWKDSITDKAATAITSSVATFDADGFNGTPCVTFPNDGTLQVTGYPDYTGPVTVYLLAQQTEAASASDFFIDGVDAGGNPLKLGVGMQSSQWRAQRSTALSGGATDTAPHLIKAVFNGAASSLQIDDNAPITGATTTDQGMTTLILGGRGGNTNRLTGRIARAIGIRGLVSTDDDTRIRNMLKTQGGLT